MHIPPHEVRPIVFAVPCPPNFSQSNGIRVMLELAQNASDLGFDVVIFPTLQTVSQFSTLPEPFQLLRISREIREGSCVILSDTISEEELVYLRSKTSLICHFSLAPPGLFRGGVWDNSYRVLPGEKHAVYSSMVSTHFPSFYHQTRFTELERVAANAGVRSAHTVSALKKKSLKVCIYSGKGSLKPVISHKLRDLINIRTSKLITRSYPVSKRSLYQLILNCDGVISFDPISSLSHEAILLGRPCLIMARWDEANFVDTFPVDLTGIAWGDEAAFCHLLKNGFNYSLVWQTYKDALAYNSAAAHQLIAYCLAEPHRILPASLTSCGSTDNPRAYWQSRQPFLSSLALPSSDVPLLTQALYPIHPGDYIHSIFYKLGNRTHLLMGRLARVPRRLRRIVQKAIACNLIPAQP